MFSFVRMSLQSLSAGGITWHYSLDASEADLQELQKKYDFHQLDIEDCLSKNERPKIEEYPHYLFCVVHVPVRSGARIQKEEIEIFLGKDFIVTIAEGKSDVTRLLWQTLQQPGELRDAYFSKGPGFFLYTLLDKVFDGGFPLIDGMMRDLRTIETELFENEEGQLRVLRDILNLKRNIITMRSILFPQRAVIALLQHKNKDLIGEELDIYFDDVSDAIERQWALLDTAKEMSEALQDTHESWLGHRTNAVVRILTIFSVTMLPLTVLTGFYGMNVHLPYQDSPQAFGVIIVLMGMIVAGFFGYFAWKKWL